MSQPIPLRTAARSRTAARIMLVLLGLAGCVISGLLAEMSMPAAGPAQFLGMTICPAAGAIDCGHVLRSRWAKVGPIGTAQLGFIYFAMLTVWFAGVGVPNRAGRRWHVVPIGLSAGGVAASAWFTFVMAARLPVWCSWCVAAHVVNGLTFLLILATWPRGAKPPTDAPAMRAHPSNARALGVLGASLAVALVLGVGLLVRFLLVQNASLYRQLLVTINDPDYIRWRWQQAPQHDVPVRPDDPMIGPPDAASTVVVFSDFECPACRELHRYAAGLVRAFPGRLRFVFKHFPLSPACNAGVPVDRHRFACEAAAAAETARAIGTPEQHRAFCDLLFEHVDRLAERPYEALAEQAGLDPDRFAEELTRGTGTERVREDVELARSLKADGRPEVEGTGQPFLDGRKLPAWNIVTHERTPRIDPAGTLRLWETLLGVEAVHRRGRANEGGGPGESAPVTAPTGG